MTRRAPRSTRTATRFPYTTLFRSVIGIVARVEQAADESGRRAAEHADRRHDRRHRERFQYIDDSFGRAIAPLAVVAGKGGDRALAILGAEIDEHQQCRSEEHASELQSLMRTSYAVICLTKNKQNTITSTSFNAESLP